jgi:hypothetical protein
MNTERPDFAVPVPTGVARISHQGLPATAAGLIGRRTCNLMRHRPAGYAVGRRGCLRDVIVERARPAAEEAKIRRTQFGGYGRRMDVLVASGPLAMSSRHALWRPDGGNSGRGSHGASHSSRI